MPNSSCKYILNLLNCSIIEQYICLIFFINVLEISFYIHNIKKMKNFLGDKIYARNESWSFDKRKVFSREEIREMYENR